MINPIYTTKTAATILESNPKTIERLCRSGELKAHKKLKKWYILESALIEYVSSTTTQAAN